LSCPCEAMRVPEDSEEEWSEEESGTVQPWDSNDELDFTPGMPWWQATFSLVVVVIGVGVMALPQLPMKGGWCMSILSMLACYVAITESGIAMWKGVMAGNHADAKDLASKAIVSYEDFGKAAFGKTGEAVVLLMMMLYFLGVVASFGVLIAEELENLIGHISKKEWLLAFAPIMILMSQLPNVTAVAKMTPLAVFCILILVSVIISKSVLDAQRWQEWPDPAKLHRDWPQDPMAMGTVVASMFGAFGVNGNVPSILCEMKDPMEFPFAYKTAMTIVLLVYLAVMCCGYYGYGDFMQPDIVKSLSSFPATEEQALDVKFDDWTGPKALVLRGVCATLLLIKLIIGLPLNMMVIYYSLQTYEGTKDCFPVGSFANKIMRVLVVVIAVVIGLAVTQFNKLFALVASVCGPMLQCFLPIFLSYKIRKKHGARMSSWVRRFGHALIVLLGLYCLTMGFYDSVQAITEKA